MSFFVNHCCDKTHHIPPLYFIWCIEKEFGVFLWVPIPKLLFFVPEKCYIPAFGFCFTYRGICCPIRSRCIFFYVTAWQCRCTAASHRRCWSYQCNWIDQSGWSGYYYVSSHGAVSGWTDCQSNRQSGTGEHQLFHGKQIYFHFITECHLPVPE